MSLNPAEVMMVARNTQSSLKSRNRVEDQDAKQQTTDAILRFMTDGAATCFLDAMKQGDSQPDAAAGV